MSYFAFFVGAAFSIALPSLAALFSFRSLPARFLPVIILLWLGLCNETISYQLIIHGRKNGLNSNIYTLLEGLLFLWSFYRLKPGKLLILRITACVMGLIWLTDNVINHTIEDHNPITRILFSFTILSISLNRIIEMLVYPPFDRFRKIDLVFYFCFFIYFTYQAFILIFDIFPMGISAEFYKRLYLILCVINLLTNIIYTVLFLWIPRQMAYTKP